MSISLKGNKITASEHIEQTLLFNWAKLQACKYPELELLYAIPNAAKMSLGAAKYMKSEGRQAGIPDLVLSVPNKKYGALYIEMKRSGRENHKNGGCTETQLYWINKLNKFGNLAVVCYSFEEAKETILNYLADMPKSDIPAIMKNNVVNCS